jgi:hypothetical protein
MDSVVWNVVTLGLDGVESSKINRYVDSLVKGPDVTYDDYVDAIRDNEHLEHMLKIREFKRSACIGVWVFILSFLFTKFYLL